MVGRLFSVTFQGRSVKLRALGRMISNELDICRGVTPSTQTTKGSEKGNPVQDQTKNGVSDNSCKGFPTTNGQGLVFGLPGEHFGIFFIFQGWIRVGEMILSRFFHSMTP